MKFKIRNLVALSVPCLLTAITSNVFAQQCQCPSAKQVESANALRTVAYVAPQEEEEDIVDTAVAAGKFNTLVAAVKAAELVETLKGTGPYTVFAPTDEAFAAIGEEKIKELLKPENKETLQGILTYHVVAGSVMAADVVKLKSAKTANGQSVEIVVADGKVTVDGANVVATDIKCANGVIHVIDKVIMPKPDIVDTAVAAGKFSMLVAAVDAAGLVDTLKGKGPFTVFAPTDEAFSAIPKEAIADLLKPENKEKLQKILTYHVVSGNVLSSDVVKLTSSKTVNGQEISFLVKDGAVTVEGANVVATDVKCGNGVIHIIDKVIMPK